MNNNYQGKYFTFFNVVHNKLQFIKYKLKEESFFSANTIWEKRIIPNLIFELEYGDEKINKYELAVFENNIEILFLENCFYENNNIEFLLINKEFLNINFFFILLNEYDYISYYNSVNITQQDPYKTFKIKNLKTGKYKILFYINNVYQYFAGFEIIKNNLSKYIIDIDQGKDNIKFNFLPDEYKGEMDLRYIDLNNFEEVFDYTAVEVYEELEELYVPLSELFDKNIKDNDFQRFLKIKLQEKYNAMGIMKIIDTLKAMDKKDEVAFIENLIKEDKELAITLIEIVFDFDLLFLIPEKEVREILNLIDDRTLMAALKGETKNRIVQIRKSLSEKRWVTISELFDSVETIDIDKTDKAQRMIGSIIRSYYQDKYGVPFVFERKKRSKYKIRKFTIEKDKKIILPEFTYNGSYLIKFLLKNEKTVNILHKVSGAEDELKFYIKYKYSTSDFFRILNITKDNIFIRFNSEIQKGMILFAMDETVQMEELNKIFPDEVLCLKYPEDNIIRMIVGVINDSETVNEAEIIINLYDIKQNKIFIPDSIHSDKKIPLQILDNENLFLYIKQNEFPVSVNREKWKDFLELEKKEKVEIGDLNNEIDIIEVSDAVMINGYVENNLNNINFVYKNESCFNIQNSSCISFLPFIIRVIDDVIYCYNLTDKKYTIDIIQDNNSIYNEKTDLHIFEFLNYDKDKKIKINIKALIGEYTYYINPVKKDMKYNYKDYYKLNLEESDNILYKIYELKKRSIFDLIIELKIYYFRFHKNKDKVLENMINFTLDRIKKEYFRKSFFVYNKDAGFNVLDIIESLLLLKEVYNKGIEKIDEMADKSLEYMKKNKLKDKRLKDYNPNKKRFKFI